MNCSAVAHRGGCAPFVVHTPSGGRAPFSGSLTLGRWKTSSEFQLWPWPICGPCGVVVRLLVVHTPSGGRAPFSGSRAPGNKLKGANVLR